MEVMEDHVHILMDIDPQFGVAKVVRLIATQEQTGCKPKPGEQPLLIKVEDSQSAHRLTPQSKQQDLTSGLSTK